MKRLYKSRTERKIFGVCGGLAQYFNVDPVVIRIIWIILAFAVGSGILAYLICALVMPDEPTV